MATEQIERPEVIERVRPKSIKGQRLGVFVSVSTLEILAELIVSNQRRDALDLIRGLRYGPRRLER